MAFFRGQKDAPIFLPISRLLIEEAKKDTRPTFATLKILAIPLIFISDLMVFTPAAAVIALINKN